jgi:hypothetical protein
MGVFSKPKLAKATPEESIKVKKELTKKYSKMMKDSDWGKPMKTPPKSVDESTVRTKAVQKGMGDSSGGIKTDQEKYAEQQKRAR